MFSITEVLSATLLVLGAAAALRHWRHLVSVFVPAGAASLRDHIEEERPAVLERLRAFITNRLAHLQDRLARLTRALASARAFSATLPSTLYVLVRGIFGHLLFAGGIAWQTAVAAMQRPDLPFVADLAIGSAFTLGVAVVGTVMVVGLVLMFRKRPPRAVAIADGLAFVCVALAVASAIALALGRGVFDPTVLARVLPLADAFLSPGMLLADVASGLVLGVYYLHNLADFIERRVQDLQREIEAWERGRDHLETVARSLGVTVAMALLAMCLSAGPLAAQKVATTSFGPSPRVMHEEQVRESTCAWMVDQSLSLDPALVRVAIDSAKIAVTRQVRTHRCAKLYASMASDDTVWIAARWYSLPAATMGATGTACTTQAATGGTWLIMMRGVNPTADTQQRSDSAAACERDARTSRSAVDRAIGVVLDSAALFVATARASGRRDVSAVYEMVRFLGGGFAAATLVSDGCNTKRLANRGADMYNTNTEETGDVLLLLVPSAPAFGGATAAVACSARLASQVPGLQVAPYVAVRTMRASDAARALRKAATASANVGR